MRKSFLIVFLILLSLLSLLSSGCTRHVDNSNPADVLSSQTKVPSDSKPINKPVAVTKEVFRESSTEWNNKFHSIIFALPDKNNIYSKAYVLGGFFEGHWYKIDDFKIEGKYTKPNDFSVPSGNNPEDFKKEMDTNFVRLDLIKGGEKFKFYSKNELVATTSIGKPVLTINGYNLDKILKVDLDHFYNKSGFIVGINGTWNPLPIALKNLGHNSFETDLDGDGTNDVVRIISKAESGEDTVNITVQSKGILSTVNTFSVDRDYITDFSILALDINGDGKLELLVAQLGHNTDVAAYQLVNGAVTKVLEFYDGD